MIGGLSVFVLVAVALLCVALGASASASERRDERERRAQRRRPYDQQFVPACGVGLSIGSDAVPASPFGAGGASPAGGEPGVDLSVAEIVRVGGLVGFVEARGFSGLAEAVAVASDADLTVAASATFGRSGIGGELHAACVAELDSRCVRRIEACRG